MGNCVFDKHGVFVYFLPYCAEMVELVDTRDLKSLGLIARTGSSPVLGTFLLYNAKPGRSPGFFFIDRQSGLQRGALQPRSRTAPVFYLRSSAFICG